MSYVCHSPGLRQAFDHRRRLLVHRAALAVEIRLVDVRIENLHLVAIGEIDAAIASPLTVAFDFGRRGEFEMQLHIAKLVLANDVVLVTLGDAVLDDPILAAHPLRHVVAIEEDHRVRRRTAIRARLDHFRFGPLDAALPLVGEHGRAAAKIKTEPIRIACCRVMMNSHDKRE